MTEQPRAATPEQVSAMLRDPGTGPDALYPARIVVFCDDCGREAAGEYVVSDRMDKLQRGEVARTHLRAAGWSCTGDADLCPDCAADETEPTS